MVSQWGVWIQAGWAADRSRHRGRRAPTAVGAEDVGAVDQLPLGGVAGGGRKVALPKAGGGRLGLLRQAAGVSAAVLGEEPLEQLLAGRVRLDVEFVEQVGAQTPVGAAHGVGV